MAKRYKFWALIGILFFLLFNYPLLQIFNQGALWGGIPVLVFYIHGVWLVAVIALYLLSSRLTYRE